ncbi:hypothetical protein SEMRO_2114_G315110.1 [Seminavis robusta]|uniref:Uncharacterized protein n=1 Tax=Seminavis robusta TaxID=568900 RepID=A0A9N8EWB8_9STRA|nr:hypothetical protein SEMRO_2114_G315110.1 [Seminavis robusta]|eukprot:Sro2114_g315110.1 n/a (137) ;mRNA; r:8851-9261
MQTTTLAEAHQKAHGSKEDASAFFETLATDNNTAAAVGSPPRQQERNPNQAQQPEVANNEDEEMQQLGQNHDNNNDFSTDLVGDSDLSEGSSDKDLDSAEYGGGEGLDDNVVAGEDDWNNKPRHQHKHESKVQILL